MKTTNNLYIAAYLRLMGLEPTFKKTGGRVVFVFDDDAATEHENGFNENALVKVADYAEKIKETRTDMYNFKNCGDSC